VIDPLRPYLYPNSHVGSLFIQFFPFFAFSELVLLLWLVIRGWKIQEPAETVVFEAREA
jgi:hypothetical protein